MALIACPVCTKEISEQAPTCPQCGHPIARQDEQTQPQKIVIEKKPPSSGCGVISGGCLTLSLILVLVVVFVAAVTKPREDALRNSLAAKYGWLFEVGSTVGEKFGLVKVSYHDYLVFSTLTIKIVGEPERTAAFGIFGQAVPAADIPRPSRSEAPRPTPVYVPANTYVPNQPENTGSNTGASSQTCFVINPSGGLVNLRKDCDRKDCSRDPSTLYTEIANDSAVTVLLTGNAYSKGYVWIPISYNGEVVWISAARLNQSCVPY